MIALANTNNQLTPLSRPPRSMRHDLSFASPSILYLAMHHQQWKQRDEQYHQLQWPLSLLLIKLWPWTSSLKPCSSPSPHCMPQVSHCYLSLEHKCQLSHHFTDVACNLLFLCQATAQNLKGSVDVNSATSKPSAYNTSMTRGPIQSAAQRALPLQLHRRRYTMCQLGHQPLWVWWVCWCQ